MQNTQPLKRDPAVELARLLGCLIVIGVHISLPREVNGMVDTSRFFLDVLFADGVAVFWMISGMFLFRDRDWKKVYRRTAESVLLPMLLLSFLLYFFNDFLLGRCSLADSVAHSPEDYRELLTNLLHWQNFCPNTEHFWFIYTYVLVMLLFPLLKWLVDALDKNRAAKIAFVAVTALLLLANDLSHNTWFSFSHTGFHAVIPACVEVIYGYLLYQNREYFRKKWVAVAAPLAFLAIALIRTWVGTTWPADFLFRYWYLLSGALSATAIIAFCLAVVPNREPTPVNKAICSLASYTFPVYLIHVFVKDWLGEQRVLITLENTFLKLQPQVLGEALYSLVVICLVFLGAWLLSLLGRQLKLALFSLIKRCKMNGE